MLIDDYHQAHEIRLQMRITQKLRGKINDLIIDHIDASRILADKKQLVKTEAFISTLETGLNKLVEDHFTRVMTELEEEFKAI